MGVIGVGNAQGDGMRAVRGRLGVKGECCKASGGGLDGLGEGGLTVQGQVAVGLVLAAAEVGQAAGGCGGDETAGGQEEDKAGDEPVEDVGAGWHGLFIPQRRGIGQFVIRQSGNQGSGNQETRKAGKQCSGN